MKLAINRKSPIGIKDQIKRQIRILVEKGELVPGQALPSAKDMAGILNVNRNTVSLAYKEMASEGLLRIVVGSGTFVNEGKVISNTKELDKIFEKALKKAKDLGFGSEQLTDFFLTRLSTYFASPKGRCILVVDCNHEAMEDISNTLKKELEVETESVLIQTLEKNPNKAPDYLKGKDLVVCGFNHAEEFRRAIPQTSVDMVAVLLKPDVRIMNELLQLHPETHVGFACANQRSTETFYKSSFFSGGSTLTRIWAGLDNSVKLKKMLDQCSVIFATNYVYERIRKMTGSKSRTIRVDLTIDPANIELVRERLNEIKT